MTCMFKWSHWLQSSDHPPNWNVDLCFSWSVNFYKQHCVGAFRGVKNSGQCHLKADFSWPNNYKNNNINMTTHLQNGTWKSLVHPLIWNYHWAPKLTDWALNIKFRFKTFKFLMMIAQKLVHVLIFLLANAVYSNWAFIANESIKWRLNLKFGRGDCAFVLQILARYCHIIWQ